MAMGLEEGLAEVLRCIKCGHFLKEDAGFLRCELCSSGYSIRDGRVFFCEAVKIVPESEFANFNPTDEKRWTNWRRSNYAYFKEKLSGLDRSKILVDIGAGPSRFRRLTTLFKYIGVDFYPHELVRVVADLTQAWPFKDGCCDIVFMSNVLEHVPNPGFLIQESRRILKAGGMLVGTVPFLVKVHQGPYDFYRYTNFMLERFLAENSFRIWKVESLGRPIDLYETVQKVFFRRLFNTHSIKANPWSRFKFRIADRLARLIFQSFRSFYALAEPSDNFTEGYGFQTWK
ncbi:MAG: methyltransferase domain-containing protein [Patescibacteria group bacterium]